MSRAAPKKRTVTVRLFSLDCGIAFRREGQKRFIIYHLTFIICHLELPCVYLSSRALTGKLSDWHLGCLALLLGNGGLRNDK
jgi:hypothetical protein